MTARTLLKRLGRIDSRSGREPAGIYFIRIPRGFRELPQTEQKRALAEMFARNGVVRRRRATFFTFGADIDRPMLDDEYMWTIRPEGGPRHGPKPAHLCKPET